MNKKILFIVSVLSILEMKGINNSFARAKTSVYAARKKALRQYLLEKLRTPSQPTSPANPITPGVVNLCNISPISRKSSVPFAIAANAGVVSLNPFVQTAVISEAIPSSPQPENNTGISNRAIINAQSNTPLAVTLAALNGATFNFIGFSGAPTGGTLVGDTLSNTTGVQDISNTATGTLVRPSGNFSGSFSDIELTGSTIINATVTGTTGGTYFTGTNFTTGDISDGNFDIIFVTLPAGTVFNIVEGDLGPTGTFTTTAPTYAYLTGGLSSPGNITNGNVTQIGTVAGIFNYLGTNVPGGTLSNLSFTGVYATGTSSDANHFVVAVPGTGTVENGGVIVITRTLATTSNNNTLFIAAGTYNNELVTGFSGVNAILGTGDFNAALTGLDGTTITILGLTCIQGIVNGTTGVHLEIPNLVSVVITDANVSGTMQAGVNSLIFTGTQILTGTIGEDFSVGTCP